ncbi:Fatty acid desaturase [uncultured virus]|nr:Fatty acid desaturase [uncultured virus]
MDIKDLIRKGRYITRIDGVYYDVTDFIQYHPGGEVIKGVCNGNDGTAMFKSSHFNLPNIKDFKRIVEIGKEPHDLPKYEFNDDSESFYNSLKTDIAHYFRTHNIDYTVPTLSSRIIFILNIILFFMCLYGSYIQGYLICSILMGILSWNFAGTLVHDHGAHRVNVKKNNVIGNLIMTCLNSITFPGALETHFIYSHYGHHSSIHDKELDSDNHLIYPLMRWSPHWNKLWYHRYQHLYWPIAYSMYLYFYFSKAFSPDKRINWWKKHNHSHRAKFNYKFIFLLFILTLHVVIPVYNFGLYGLLNVMIFIAIYSCGGLFFATVNHLISDSPLDNNLEIKKSSSQTMIFVGNNRMVITNEDHKDRNEWAYNVVATSPDYLINDFFATYISGGFNLHGLHHLLPSIHPSHLSKVYHIYQAKCRQHGYPLIVINSWRELFRRYTYYLYRLGN